MDTKIREIFPGRYYRYFKGNIYKVLGIATHSETREHLVVYQSEDGKWYVRPYGMFASEVDREKYPNAAQQYRFELME